jgi:hypothetical protein
LILITTKNSGLLTECPKRVLQSHAQNPLIFQAQNHADRLAEKAHFSGRLLV